MAITRATATDGQSPKSPTRDATRNPDIEATDPTERSMPPVSIVSTWQPARIARGTAVRRIPPAQVALTWPGRTSS